MPYVSLARVPPWCKILGFSLFYQDVNLSNFQLNSSTFPAHLATGMADSRENSSLSCHLPMAGATILLGVKPSFSGSMDRRTDSSSSAQLANATSAQFFLT